jgi:hypothetical protein
VLPEVAARHRVWAGALDGAGAAVDLVEGLTGRQDPVPATAMLPEAVATQVQRASLVF